MDKWTQLIHPDIPNHDPYYAKSNDRNGCCDRQKHTASAYFEKAK